MPLALIRIAKAKWYRHSWLSREDVGADALTDLKTKGNTLSIWMIDDERSNLDQVVAALAAGRHKLGHFDYALLDYALLEGAGLAMKRYPGTTRDREANDYHVDIVQLTARDIGQLAEWIAQSPDRTRVPEWEVGSLLDEAVAHGRIDGAEMDGTLVLDLNKKRSSWAEP